MKTLGRRGGENVGDVFVEEYLRELWERTSQAILNIGTLSLRRLFASAALQQLNDEDGSAALLR